MAADYVLTPWQRFIRFLSLERRDILQISYYAIFSRLVALSLPLGAQAIINLVQGAQISTSWVVLVVLVTVGLIFSGILQLMQVRIIETMQQRVFARASFELSYRFPKITMSALRNHYPPELANRFFDTLTIQKGLSKVLIDVPSAIIEIAFALIILSFYHSFFILFGLVLIVSVYLVFQYTGRKGLQTSLEESKHKYKVTHWIQEIARAVVSFKLSGKTHLAMRKNDLLVYEYLKARENHFKIIRIQFLKMIGFKVIISTGLLVVGGVLVLNQQMNIGQFVAAEIIILLVVNSVEKVILGLETLYDMLTSIEKLGQVVDKPLELQKGEKPSFEKGVDIQLDAISYRVPGREKNILDNVSLTIAPKSRVLIYGGSGSGKSTLLRLIAGLIHPSEGYLYVNNLSITSLNLNHYRTYLGLSLSEEMPFEGTLRENLTFGDNTISEEKIYWALEQVRLLQFLKEQPQGLGTILYPEGKRISYTISKRIVLARAILKNPKVLILEDTLDPFSQTETRSIIDFLCQPSHPWSLVVVGSNDHWRTHCHEIIQMVDGRIKTEKT